MRWQRACCRCSGSLHDGFLDVNAETILLRTPPDVDGSIVLDAIPDDVANDDATLDVLFAGYPILDAIHDVDANLLDANLLLLLLHILPPILVVILFMLMPSMRV